MEIHRRAFTYPEIEHFYAPRIVYEVESHFMIRPLNDSEGPIVLEIPKILPVTEDNELIDLTLAYEDFEHDIDDALGVQFDGDVSLRFGRSDAESSTICQRLLLDDTAEPDTMQIIAHHYGPDAWGGARVPVMPRWLRGTGGVLLHKRVYLQSPEHIDFWLLRISCITPKLGKAIKEILHVHRCELLEQLSWRDISG